MSELEINLEIIKVAVSIFTPAVLLLLGFLINRRLKEIEQQQWSNRTIIEWRIKVFDEVSPALNDIYCYMRYVGNWKELSPEDILKRKRFLDKKIHTTAALFSRDFADSYVNFMKVAFKMYRGMGKDAAIRSDFKNHKESYPGDWVDGWSDLFVGDEDLPSNSQIEEAYKAVQSVFSRELSLDLNGAC